MKEEEQHNFYKLFFMKNKVNKIQRKQDKISGEDVKNEEKPLNPFKDKINAKGNKKIAEEEISGEQQRKQAITERD
jgi:hypothetical protein